MKVVNNMHEHTHTHDYTSLYITPRLTMDNHNFELRIPAFKYGFPYTQQCR